jgi:hypothetical protein
LGNQLTQQKIKNIVLKEALPYDDNEGPVEEIEVNDLEELNGDDEDSQIKLNL